MTNTVSRFSNRVENYAKYRPGYPEGLLAILKSECGLQTSSVIADIGSGTGISSQIFLDNGNQVLGVEPNPEMRAAAERLLSRYPAFVSVAATAEQTTIETGTVDFVTAAQAFHWFDRSKAKQEFARILKRDGWVVLIWNERRLDSTPFLQTYEDFLLRFGTDYEVVRHEKVASEIAEFFAPQPFQLKNLENFQHFNFESLKGRLLSASYVPAEGHAKFEPMLAELKDIFQRHQQDGIVSFEYETRIYYGQLGSAGTESG